MTEDLAARIPAHYEKHARDWDRDRQAGGRSDRPWIDRFLDRLEPGMEVLDLGCGSGWPVARHLAERGFRVTGVDASPSMIALCRERLPRQDWIVGDMRSLSLNRRFEGILAWDSFFHLAPEDQRRMFQVFAGHAAPGAHLLFNAGPAAGEAIGEYRGDPLYHASLAAAEYESLAKSIGFEVIHHVAEDQAAGGRTAWLCRHDSRSAR